MAKIALLLKGSFVIKALLNRLGGRNLSGLNALGHKMSGKWAWPLVLAVVLSYAGFDVSRATLRAIM